MDTTKPTIVFVHGAWADNSGWDGSIRALRGQGFSAIGAANPLRELRSDAAYVATLLRSIEGPIVMVGHSYGGAVISNAATGNDQVRALVYINGWVPDEGESLVQLAGRNDGSLINESVRPVAHTNADGSKVVDLYLDQEKFRGAFAGDVDPGTAQVMAVAQRPFTEAAFGAASGPVAWRSVPSWYLLGTEDKAIPPATQRFMAERANASIVEIPASHASMVSRPDAVTELILTAVNATAGRETVGASG
jgi:pimeloyl-ACP methyl ester carboxylesterase